MTSNPLSEKRATLFDEMADAVRAHAAIYRQPAPVEDEPCATCGALDASLSLGRVWICDVCHAAEPMFCSCCGFKLHTPRTAVALEIRGGAAAHRKGKPRGFPTNPHRPLDNA